VRLIDVTYRLGQVRRAAGRATVGPLVARSGVFAAATGALLTAYPLDLIGPAALLLMPVALLAAVAPGSRMVTFAALVAVAGWLLTTSAAGGPVPVWRLLAVAGLLYVMHSLAALAAGLPYHAVTAPEVLAGWVLRAVGVAAGAAALGAVLLAAVTAMDARPLLAASLTGLVVAVSVAALLTFLPRRGG
jgi:hypothetical protein